MARTTTTTGATASWGALSDEWAAFEPLLQGDMWACVCNPNLERAPSKLDTDPHRPTGKDFSKIPSSIRDDGKAHRYVGWTRLTSKPAQRKGWAVTPDLGFGAVCRRFKGIDIDIDDPDMADEVDAFIADTLGLADHLPARMRSGTGSRMLIYRLNEPGVVRRKRVIKTAHGAIEFLFDKQFMALAGVHHSGSRLTWPDGLPTSEDDVPRIEPGLLNDLMDKLQAAFGVDDSPATSGYHHELAKPRDANDADVVEVERVVEVLEDAGLFREYLDGGKIAVTCPWQHLHGSTGGEADHDPSKTVLFPPGVGGFAEWGFRCMHTEGHGEKSYSEFAEVVGIVPSEFGVVEYVDPADEDHLLTRPLLRGVSKSGVAPGTPYNLQMAMTWPGLGMEFYEDEFMAHVLVSIDGSTPRPLQDHDYFELQLRLSDKFNIQSAGTQAVREAVGYVAHHRRRDTATEWAKSLVWDGVDRFTGFHTKVLNTKDTLYNQEVVRYLFTALAGRCITPGVQADMTPVLVGRQGTRKSSFVEALAPISESYLPINLADKDDDLSRKLRGKLVVEAEELRGMSAKDEDSLKAWLTRTKETWVPKYKEMSKDYLRRFIVIGTTNNARFLNDPTGARRWLPVSINGYIDVDYVKENCIQLWAQGVHEFIRGGVQWQKAEMLAIDEAPKYTRITPRETALREWLKDRAADGFTTTDMLVHALGIGIASSSAHLAGLDVEKTMIRLGYSQDDDGRWRVAFL